MLLGYCRWPAGAEEKMPPLSLPTSALLSSPLSPTKASVSPTFRGSRPQSPPSGSPRSGSPRSPRSPRSPTTPRSPHSGSRVVRTAHTSSQGQHQQARHSIHSKQPVLPRLSYTETRPSTYHLTHCAPRTHLLVN